MLASNDPLDVGGLNGPPRIGESRTMTNAGHLAPFLNGEAMAMEGSLPLGIIAGAEFAESRFTLNEGDEVSLYTDGVLEAQNEKGELFGFERCASLMRGMPSVQEIAEAAKAFGQEDDITVVKIARVREDDAREDVGRFEDGGGGVRLRVGGWVRGEPTHRARQRRDEWGARCFICPLLVVFLFEMLLDCAGTFVAGEGGRAFGEYARVGVDLLRCFNCDDRTRNFSKFVH
jgi:hypothetical protein